MRSFFYARTGRPFFQAGPVPGQVSQALLAFFSPPICPVCDRVLEAATRTCRHCRGALSEALADPVGRCGRCFSLDPHCICSSRNIYFDRHVALYRLTPGWREVLHRWKFEQERWLWRYFAGALRRIGRRSSFLGSVDHVSFIGSGKGGLRFRSYQPCADPAFALSRWLGCSVGADVQKRRSRSQSAAGYAARFLALHNSLALEGGPFLAGRHVLLLEDLFTTGATANEAARILKKNGVGEVSVLSLLVRDRSL